MRSRPDGAPNRRPGDRETSRPAASALAVGRQAHHSYLGNDPDRKLRMVEHALLITSGMVMPYHMEW
jgi:hypothetical protein